MGEFRERLRRIRRKADEERERRGRGETEQSRRARETAERVQRAADELEAHIERCLKAFQGEFVEFRFDAYTREGRHFRVFWDEPVVGEGGRPDKLFHQLSFQVRRYPEYADIEVIAKAIVRNRDRRRLAQQEDVWEGDPARLFGFVEQAILEFTRLYTGQESSDAG